MQNAINWFELPVEQLERAQKFYETLLAIRLKAGLLEGLPMAVFPYAEGVGGALVKSANHRPATDGAVVYLNANGSLDACLARVAAAGGRLLQGKTDIGDPGFVAILLDTEGNRVGLHDRVRTAPRAS
jgi:hypothetical protein